MNRCVFAALLLVLLSAFAALGDATQVSPLRRAAKKQIQPQHHHAVDASTNGGDRHGRRKHGVAKHHATKGQKKKFATPELEARWGAPDSQAPVIGIFTNDLSWSGSPQPPANLPNGNRATEWVEAYYVHWLEAAGVRVVPFPWNVTFSEQQALMRKVNGVLFPGGGLGGDVLQYYVNKVGDILDQAKEWNAQGDPFFIWGTCQGFQVLSAAAAQRDPSIIVGPYQGMYPLMMPLNPTPAFWNSALYGAAPASVVDAFTTQAATLNWHHECILNSTFDTYPGLDATFERLSTDVVPNTDVVFVSSLEGKNGLNVFATQYHPERPPLSYSDPKETHTDAAIEVSQYLSHFVRERLMRNTHQFASQADLEAAVIENYPAAYFGQGATEFFTWH
jgi:gamma-glutamyl hydrolase